MDKLIYLGFALSELSKLLMYEAYYDNQKTFSEKKVLQCHYFETDAFVLGISSSILSKAYKILTIFWFLQIKQRSWSIQ